MEIKEAVIWALVGGGSAEVTLALTMMRPSSAKKSWAWPLTRPETPIYCCGMISRLFISGALAAPCAATGKISDGFMAFLLGIAAPPLLARLAATAHAAVGRTSEGTGSEQFASQAEIQGIPGARAPEGAPSNDLDATGEENVTQ
ncbi:hypothetical protein [Streptomyces sp. NBC_00658]|uniref:hypothetical protein n=1 Tax=Streptomyces sp. NBC_00658 TaxID=2975800 RepID=UPI003245483B